MISTSNIIIGILVSSTALIGLTGLFLGYIKFSLKKSQLNKKEISSLTVGLSIALISGIVVIIISIVTLMFPSEPLFYIAWCSFIWQFTSFSYGIIRGKLLF